MLLDVNSENERTNEMATEIYLELWNRNDKDEQEGYVVELDYIPRVGDKIYYWKSGDKCWRVKDVKHFITETRNLVKVFAVYDHG